MYEKEFIQAYDRFADKIFRHLYFRIHDRERAKDLMQETFMKTWIAVTKGIIIENMQAFLYKVANNVLIDEIRKHRAVSLEEMEEEVGFVPAAPDIYEEIHAHLDADNVLDLLKNLSEEYRAVIVMRFVDELSPKEIARILEVSENLISVRLHRAIAELRKFFPS